MALNTLGINHFYTGGWELKKPIFEQNQREVIRSM